MFPYLSVPGTEASGTTVDRATMCVDVFFIDYHSDLWRKKKQFIVIVLDIFQYFSCDGYKTNVNSFYDL